MKKFSFNFNFKALFYYLFSSFIIILVTLIFSKYNVSTIDRFYIIILIGLSINYYIKFFNIFIKKDEI